MHAACSAKVLDDLWPSLDHLMQYYERNVDATTGLLLTGARGDWVPPLSNGIVPLCAMALFSCTTVCHGVVAWHDAVSWFQRLWYLCVDVHTVVGW